MQRLFSRAIRFKDDQGNDFPDWEERPLGEIGRFIGGGTPDTRVAEFWVGKMPWISSSDIPEGVPTGVSLTRFISARAISESATKPVPQGAILIVSRVGVGKLSIAPVDLCTSQDFCNFVPTGANGKYLAYLMLARPAKLKSLSQGTSIKGLTIDELKRMNCEIPQPDEQRKIADFLSAIDTKIQLVAKELDQACAFKKGLLQQMFV